MKRAAGDIEQNPPSFAQQSEFPSHTDIASHAALEYLAAPGVNWSQLHLEDLKSTQLSLRTKCLSQIARHISLFKGDQYETLARLLVERLEEEPDNDAKVMVILLLEKLSRLPNIDAFSLLNKLAKQLSSTSTKVRCQLYICIHNILKVRQMPFHEESHAMIVHICERVFSELTDRHYRVRSVCIRLFSLFAFLLEKFESGSSSIPSKFRLSLVDVQHTVSRYVCDGDPRVRKSALDTLVGMHLRGASLEPSLYSLAVTSLRDDYEQVRMGGLNLIWALSCHCPEIPLRLQYDQSQETVRLIDDAFVKICDLVNDASVVIRTKACVIMASYQHVNPDVLSQTFSKQIMSHLRRKVTDKSRQKKQIIPVAEGDFDVESDDFRLLDSGACGSFIHGLEDEYQEVRNASIDSICELCMYNDQFVNKATECLVDMFNDEIDKIRVNAIQSLRKIGTRWPLELNAEQLENTLGTLEDNDETARRATHELLTVVRMKEKESLNSLLEALMANMKRYPRDQLSIFRCLRDVGKKHDDYIASQVSDLLKLDRRFLPREANVEDLAYTANVILIVNACVSDTKILAMLPKYMFRHFAYYKGKYPDCLPDLYKLYSAAAIKLEGDMDCLPATQSASDSKLVAANVEDYMAATLEMLRSIRKQMEASDYKTATWTLDVAIKNFEYITYLKPSLAGRAQLALVYLQAYKMAIKIKQSHTSPAFAATAQLSAGTLLRLTYTMQHTFLGLSPYNLQVAMSFRILANMIWMFGVIKQMSISNDTSLTIKGMIDAFIRRIDQLKPSFDSDIYRHLAMDDLRLILSKASTSPTTAKMSALHSFVTGFIPLEIDVNNSVKRTRATITQPSPNPDKPHKFLAKFPVKLAVEAEIENVAGINDIVVEIVFPDQSLHMFWPASNHFTPTTPYCYSLRTSIELHPSTWTEMSTITLCIARSFEPELPGLDDYIMKYPNAANRSMRKDGISRTATTVVVSNEIRYAMLPRERLDT